MVISFDSRCYTPFTVSQRNLTKPYCSNRVAVFLPAWLENSASLGCDRYCLAKRQFACRRRLFWNISLKYLFTLFTSMMFITKPRYYVLYIRFRGSKSAVVLILTSKLAHRNLPLNKSQSLCQRASQATALRPKGPLSDFGATPATSIHRPFRVLQTPQVNQRRQKATRKPFGDQAPLPLDQTNESSRWGVSNRKAFKPPAWKKLGACVAWAVKTSIGYSVLLLPYC